MAEFCYGRDRVPRLTNRDTPYITEGNLPPQKNGRRPMFDRESHERAMLAAERLLAGNHTIPMRNGMRPKFRPIIPINNPKGKGKGAPVQTPLPFQPDDCIWNPNGYFSSPMDYISRMPGQKSFGKGKGKGKGSSKGKSANESLLNMELDNYMGVMAPNPAACTELDDQLDKYFDDPSRASTK